MGSCPWCALSPWRSARHIISQCAEAEQAGSRDLGPGSCWQCCVASHGEISPSSLPGPPVSLPATLGTCFLSYLRGFQSKGEEMTGPTVSRERPSPPPVLLLLRVDMVAPPSSYPSRTDLPLVLTDFSRSMNPMTPQRQPGGPGCSTRIPSLLLPLALKSCITVSLPSALPSSPSQLFWISLLY